MKKIIFGLLVFGFSGSVFAAGDERGNGGDVVVCRDPSLNITDVELLDHYEAKVLRDIQIDLGVPGGNFHDKVSNVLNRLEKLAPRRAKKYKDWSSVFLSESSFLSNIDLVDIPDSNHIVLPKGCKIEQIAIRRNPERPQDKRYVINKDLWNLLGNDGKAGLILHELIYREMFDLGQTNSVSSRYLNSVLSSGLVEGISKEYFIGMLGEIGILNAEWGRWTLDLKAEKPYFNQQQLIAATLFGSQSYVDPGGSTIVEFAGKIRFYQNGNLRFVILKSQPGTRVIGMFKGKYFLLEPGTAINFHPTGDVQSYFQPAIENYLDGIDYHLSPRGLRAMDSAVVYMELEENSAIRLCLQCVGTASLNGRTVHIGVNPKSEHIYSGDPDALSGRAIYPSFKQYNGQISEIFITRSAIFPILNRHALFSASSQIEFYQNGQVHIGDLAEELALKILGHEAYFIGRILVDPRSELGSDIIGFGTLARDAKLIDENDTVQLYPRGARIEFFRGKVIEAKFPD